MEKEYTEKGGDQEEKREEKEKILRVGRARRERKNHYGERKEYPGMFSFMFYSCTMHFKVLRCIHFTER